MGRQFPGNPATPIRVLECGEKADRLAGDYKSDLRHTFELVAKEMSF
jgi:hypothetical protein